MRNGIFYMKQISFFGEYLKMLICACYGFVCAVLRDSLREEVLCEAVAFAFVVNLDKFTCCRMQ
jgi:hypothetical protein